jgi:hypothetical protein
VSPKEIFYAEYSLLEGFGISLPIFEKRQTSHCSGWEFFISARHAPIVCFCCGIIADRWVVGKHKHDRVGVPVMNLYALNQKKELVMMTRDHIIPKSLGGIDIIENLRPACTLCNMLRGNELAEADLLFLKANPGLQTASRIKKGLASLHKTIALINSHPELTAVQKEREVQRLKMPFQQAGIYESLPI